MSNGMLDAFYSLGAKFNKMVGRDNEETAEGVVSEKLPELKLNMSNVKILRLTKKWEKAWIESTVYAEWSEAGEKNENYWLGKQFNQPKISKIRPLQDNVIFESLETYLPQATRRNPDPMVLLDSEENQEGDNQKFVSDLQKKLGEIADELKLRLKLKKVARHWAIYLLGAVKLGWDLNKDIPTAKVIRAKKLILDPEATIDEDGYTGKYVGEYRKHEASLVIKFLEANDGEKGAIKFIEKLVDDKLGTDIQFIEWWTDEYMCWTLGKQLLLKKKNPHWNYAKDVEVPADENSGEVPLDEETKKPQTTRKPGSNHFPIPKIPFVFLSVFNLGKKPVDDTSLISQNLASQDLVNKRLRQIDKNADSMNGGMVVSGARSGLTQKEAKGVTKALRKGGTVWIPSGAPDEAVKRTSAPSLPGDVYTQLIDTRNRMRDVFGTRGSSPAGLQSEKTVRGKFQNERLDTDRIGGGLSEYLEQLSDDVYNWFVQLLYVYDEKYVLMSGPKPKIIVSVKEGSLLPKDSMTIANQAIELAGGGKMSTIDLYKRLDYPNPKELAANVWLEANAPDVLFADDERVQKVIQAQQQAQQQQDRPPSESINFKDLPPAGKVQMAQQAGIDLDPEALAAYDAFIIDRDNKSKAKEKSPAKPNISKEE